MSRAVEEANRHLLRAKAYYGLPDKGWVIELVAYDVNVVFLGGAAFNSPPPLSSGTARYVKLKTLDEAQQPRCSAWIE